MSETCRFMEAIVVGAATTECLFDKAINCRGEFFQIFDGRTCKWMMNGHETSFFLIVFKEREVNYPEEFVAGLIDKIELFCQFQTEATEHVGDIFRLVGDNQDDIAGLGAGNSFDLFNLFRTELFLQS